MDAGHAETLDQIIDALYRTAADPDAWAELVDILPRHGEIAPAASAATHRDLTRALQISEEVAARASLQTPGIEPALLILAEDLRVITATPQARLAMPVGLGALAVGQRLRFREPDDDDALLKAVVRLRAEPGPTMVRFGSADGDDRPTFAYLARDSSGPGSFRLLFSNAQGGGDLQLGLGLTAAETRLANQFRLSRSISEAAEALGVSVHTARNQLASVFAKLGIQRQSDLIRILTELALLESWIEPGQTAPRAHPAPDRRSFDLKDGRRLSYRVYGAAAKRVLLTFHEGLGSSLLPYQTDGLAQRLGLQIVSIDRPGYGASTRHRSYSFSSVAADAHALCAHLGLTEVTIVGLMAGAPSALQTAIRLGPMVRRVFICSGRPPHAAPADVRNPLMMFRAQLQANGWLTETLFALLKNRLSPRMVERSLRRAAQASPGDGAYLAAHPEMVAFLTASCEEALAGGGAGPTDDIKAFRGAEDFALERLQAPLHIWHGAEDHLTPLDAFLRFVGAHPYDLTEVPAIGQFMILKHWEELLQTIADT